MFCKADDYRTIVKLIDGNIYNVNLTLSEVVNKVNNKYLIRCHRSYAINLDFLHSIKHDLSFVKLESDDEIPISVRKRRVIKKKLIELGFI